ncbi:hypothetical protein GGE08_001963 [Muricauda sp. ARW1Y1]|nr:hypothetical protein [Muricauda sp. ARW1Y1]
MSKIIYGVGSRQMMLTPQNNGTETSFLLVHTYSFDVLPFPLGKLYIPFFTRHYLIYGSIN